MARVGFLGCGTIATAIVDTVAPLGHDIYVSARSVTVSQELAERYPSIKVMANDAVVSESDIVIVCLLGDVAREVLPRLPFRQDHAVISVMAGVSLGDLTDLTAPASDCSIAIPLLSMPVGQTPLVTFPASSAQTTVFGECVVYHPCADEIQMNAHFAATGALLPFLDLMATVSDWLGNFTGDSHQAQSYIAGLLHSQCAVINPREGKSIAQFQAGLSIPGGLNFTLSHALKNAGAAPALHEGLDSLRARLGLPPTP